MPLPSSGQLSIGDVFVEMFGTLPGTNGNVSLSNMSQNYNTDPCNTAAVNGVAPHSLEEFYNYDHHCGGGGGGSCVNVEIEGPFGDFGEGCEMGGRGTCLSLYATSTALVVGDEVYDDQGCSSPFAGGNLWYYDCLAGARVIQIDDAGVIQGEALCGGKSDIRLKHNIERIGTSPSGIPIYTFEYLDDDKHVHEGTMAQDLIEMGREDLVIMDRDGYYRVLYHLTDVKMVKRSK